MNDVHWGKFVLGALIVTAVCFMTDGFLHQRLIHDQWLALSTQLGITIRDHAGWKMVYFVVFEAGRGFLTMYVYVLLRPAPRGEREDRRLRGRRRLGDLLAHRACAVHPARLLQRELVDQRCPLSARLLDRGGDRRSSAVRREGQPHIDALAAHVRGLRARRERDGGRPRSRGARHGALSGQLLAGSAAGVSNMGWLFCIT